MIRKADRQLAERLKCSLLEHNIPLYKLIMFGSRARGDAGPESDLDVLVLVEHVDAMLRKTISHCAWEIGFETGVLIQTVVMTREEAEHGFALKSSPAEAPLAHQRLLETMQLLSRFRVIVFDQACSEVMARLRRQHRRHKRYTDMMIAAIAEAGRHILVTRNQADFVDLLPPTRLVNWIDDPPG